MLPTKKVKKWNTDNARLKVDPNWKPLRPNFCPVIHEDTGKRCGKMMDMWDQMFYEQYGLCQQCMIKYNNHLPELKEKIAAITDGEK